MSERRRTLGPLARALALALVLPLAASIAPGCVINHATPRLPSRADEGVGPDDSVINPGDDVPTAPDVPVDPCGERDQACCPGDTCHGGIVCAGGTCLCGGSGQVCCPDTTGRNVVCDSPLSCVDGECACGGEGGTCCAGANPCGPNLQCAGGRCVCGAAGQVCCAEGRCATGSTCMGSTCVVAPTCLADGVACSSGSSPGCCAGLVCPPGTGAHCTGTPTCGQPGQPCCPGNACNSGAACVNPLNVGPACVACGNPGQACCPGGSCTGGATCAAGVMAVSAYGDLCVLDGTSGALGEHCGNVNCDPNAFCRGYSRDVRRCVACGDRDETCCARGACAPGLQCSSDTSGSYICIPF